MKTIVVCILFVVLLNQILDAQSNSIIKNWEIEIGAFEKETGSDNCLCKNGDFYYVFGSSNSYPSGWKTEPNCNDQLMTYDNWLVKFDLSGNKVWDKRYGGLDVESPVGVECTSDGGCLIYSISVSDSGCNKISNDFGQGDIWILKIDSLGSIQWQRRYGGAGADYVTKAIKANSNHYYLAAWTYSAYGNSLSDTSHGGSDVWILKINANNGSKVWDKLYGSIDNEFCEDIIELQDGNLIFVGNTSVDLPNGDVSEPDKGDGLFDYDGWIVKIDTSGTKMWDKRYGGNRTEILTSVLELADSTLLFGGGMVDSSYAGDISDSIPRGKSDNWLLKTDFLGNKIWDKRFGSNSWDGLSSIINYKNDFLLICESESDSGYEKSENRRGTTYYDYWLLCVDSLGNRVWDKTLGSDARDEFPAAVVNADNSITICGYSTGDISYDKQVPTWDTTTNFNGWRGDLWCINFFADTILSLNEINGSISLHVFPNPATNQLTVAWPASQKIETIFIYDLMGRVVQQIALPLETKNQNAENKLQISINELSTGIYIIEATGKNRSGRIKVVKY